MHSIHSLHAYIHGDGDGDDDEDDGDEDCDDEKLKRLNRLNRFHTNRKPALVTKILASYFYFIFKTLQF